MPSGPDAGFPQTEQSEKERSKTCDTYYDKGTRHHFHNILLVMKGERICHFGMKIILS